ncbi:MAG: hypothetical protein PHG06_11340 [Parabacteroides sp.]|nr:hypothetical protein [Parabacteroides sp.]
MKKILVLILVLLVLLLTGCSIIDKLAEKFTGCKKTDGKAGIADDLNVVVVNTAPDLMEFPSRSIGDANFKVETSKSAKMKYSADGKEQSISVTDDSGIEWTIKIPENALINEEEISITPLSGIEVDNFPGSEFHGILLKPVKIYRGR